MSKDKQTEEMARTIYKNSDVNLEYARIIAGALINHGYRKQSEGEWLTDRYGMEHSICSLCGATYEGDGGNYCRNCGAKMKGGAE